MEQSVRPQDKWSAGEAYEPYVGRWSRLIAAEFVRWLGLPKDLRWLDVGCGTGALSAAILAHGQPQRLFGVDAAEAFLAFARRGFSDSRVELRRGDAMALPAADAEFDAAVSGLVLNFVPDPRRALSEMRRVVRPGGTVAVYVWDYAAGMEMMRRFWSAAAALDPAANALDEGRRFAICNTEALRALFDRAGLGRIEARAIDIPTVFRDFDDYWTPFLGGQGPAPGYCVSLPEARRAQLRDTLRAELPTAPDGSIHLQARALAIRSVRPD